MSNLPLRERKYASTKASLMNELILGLTDQTLEEINVKDICENVQVSATTFFNYFPTKHHAIGYRIQLWSIDTIYQMQQQIIQGKTQLDTIRTVFDSAAQIEKQTPGLMREIVVFQASQKLDFAPLTLAEYAHHFPNFSDITDIQAEGVNTMIGNALLVAQKDGEIAGDMDTEALTVILLGIFFLTPVLLLQRPDLSVQDVYHRELDIIFNR
jgi:AcrR family transcriptional regulator